jgi:hypothetical protein
MTILLQGISIIVIIEDICVKFQLLQILLILVVSDVIVIIFIIAGNNHKSDDVGSLGWVQFRKDIGVPRGAE